MAAQSTPKRALAIRSAVQTSGARTRPITGLVCRRTWYLTAACRSSIGAPRTNRATAGARGARREGGRQRRVPEERGDDSGSHRLAGQDDARGAVVKRPAHGRLEVAPLG